MKLLKTLLTLILLSGSLAASAEDVVITEWHTHFTNARDDNGNIEVTCNASGSSNLKKVTVGNTHKCPGVSKKDANNNLYYVTEGRYTTFGKFNHQMKSCSNEQNLLTVTAKGKHVPGGQTYESTANVETACSQDMNLSGISQ